MAQSQKLAKAYLTLIPNNSSQIQLWAGHIIRMPPDDQPITPCCGPLVVVADDEVVQRRLGGPHLERTWWTEESIGTASGLWL